jgi:triosephosphate isomerase
MTEQVESRLSKKEFTLIANWKMNKTIREALKYVESLLSLLEGVTLPIWLAVPFTAIHSVRERLALPFVIGAQNMNDATSGAFTGEIAAAMIKDAGGDFVLLGHSERRQYFHESDEFINRKVHRALESSLHPVLCIGEGYEEREGGKTQDVVERQLTEGLKDVMKEQILKCMIAYEPIWAIGTGKTATTEIVEETHAIIRKVIASLFDDDIAAQMPILYGGSVSSSSSADILAKTEGVNGFLIGTASLDPESFAKIARMSENAHLSKE